MKTFIFNFNKNKKWTALGLSILYLLLFCFPLVTFSKGYYEDASEASYFRLPFILSLPYDWMRFPAAIKTTELSSAEHKAYVTLYIAQNITCSILIFICLVLATICIIRQFKGKKFYFLPSLTLAFLTMLVAGIYMSCHSSQGVEEIKYHLDFYPTTYIFLVLLVLDIAYLCLEHYYLHGGQEKLAKLNAKRKAVKEAQQEATLKQSTKYRIEQLEKELQELKAKNDEQDSK